MICSAFAGSMSAASASSRSAYPIDRSNNPSARTSRSSNNTRRRSRAASHAAKNSSNRPHTPSPSDPSSNSHPIYASRNRSTASDNPTVSIDSLTSSPPTGTKPTTPASRRQPPPPASVNHYTMPHGTTRHPLQRRSTTHNNPSPHLTPKIAYNASQCSTSAQQHPPLHKNLQQKNLQPGIHPPQQDAKRNAKWGVGGGVGGRMAAALQLEAGGGGGPAAAPGGAWLDDAARQPPCQRRRHRARGRDALPGTTALRGATASPWVACCEAEEEYELWADRQAANTRHRQRHPPPL